MCQKSLFIFFLQYLLNHDGCPPERSMTWVFSGWSVQQHDARITTSLLQLRIVGWSIPVAACLRLLLQNSHLLQKKAVLVPKKKERLRLLRFVQTFWKVPNMLGNTLPASALPPSWFQVPALKQRPDCCTPESFQSPQKAMWGIKIWICAICASM